MSFERKKAIEREGGTWKKYVMGKKKKEKKIKVKNAVSTIAGILQLTQENKFTIQLLFWDFSVFFIKFYLSGRI